MPANIDSKTGTRYGVVSLHSLEDWVFDEFFHNGTNITYEAAKAEYLKEHHDPDDESDDAKSEEQVTEEFNNDCNSDEEEYTLETDGMQLGLFMLGGAYNVWVMQSPHTTNCRQCSPCCPNAGDLNNKDADGVLTYDLPPDWYRKEEDHENATQT